MCRLREGIIVPYLKMSIVMRSGALAVSYNFNLSIQQVTYNGAWYAYPQPSQRILVHSISTANSLATFVIAGQMDDSEIQQLTWTIPTTN